MITTPANWVFKATLTMRELSRSSRLTKRASMRSSSLGRTYGYQRQGCSFNKNMTSPLPCKPIRKDRYLKKTTKKGRTEALPFSPLRQFPNQLRITLDYPINLSFHRGSISASAHQQNERDLPSPQGVRSAPPPRQLHGWLHVSYAGW